jgi:hypothetical protein
MAIENLGNEVCRTQYPAIEENASGKMRPVTF